jgi:DNA-binding NtrC family response regulator
VPLDDTKPTEARLVAAERAASPRRALLVMSPTGVFTHALPDRGVVSIGRSSECDVRIDDAKASRKHALLHVAESCAVEDAGSTNGTALGDRKLTPQTRVPIRAGEHVTIGSTVLVVQNTAAPPARVWSKEAFAQRVDAERVRAARERASFGLLLVDLTEWREKSASQSTSSSRTRNEAARVERLEQIFRDCLRPTDAVGSTGPARFEVLLPGTSADETDAIGARIDRELHDAGFARAIQVASFPRDGDTRDSLEAHAGAVRADADATKAVARGGTFERRVSPMIERIASGDINVLVLGETGVGKEVMARELHARSPRADKPLVSINCAALSESLLESELFGHEKGAFTGALAAKAGLLESADGGTVFLDEVGEMPLTLQAKLLRVLEQREVQRVGSLRPRAIDVRFVAATNRHLEEEIAAKRFRQDLYFRLNGVAVEIPPLRARVDEIEPLARAFVEQACERSRRRVVPRIAPRVMELLRRHTWPGNIRELRNVMERAVLLTTGDEIALDSFPTSMMGAALSSPPPAEPKEPPFDPEETAQVSAVKLDAVMLPGGDERARIVAALKACNGNQTQAAKVLGISRRTLVSRLAQYDLPRPRRRDDDD